MRQTKFLILWRVQICQVSRKKGVIKSLFSGKFKFCQASNKRKLLLFFLPITADWQQTYQWMHCFFCATTMNTKCYFLRPSFYPRTESYWPFYGQKGISVFRSKQQFVLQKITEEVQRKDSFAKRSYCTGNLKTEVGYVIKNRFSEEATHVQILIDGRGLKLMLVTTRLPVKQRNRDKLIFNMARRSMRWGWASCVPSVLELHLLPAVIRKLINFPILIIAP